MAHDNRLPYADARHALGPLIALGRVGLGAGALVAPEFLLSTWVGKQPAAERSVQVLGRALGARDIALGGLALQAVLGGRRSRAARTAIALGALADGVDMAATLHGWNALPRGRRWATLALTLGATVAGVLAVLE